MKVIWDGPGWNCGLAGTEPAAAAAAAAVAVAFVVPLIDWISDTLFQGYTNLQSLVKCLDHRNFYNMQSSKGCVRLHDAVAFAVAVLLLLGLLLL